MIIFSQFYTCSYMLSGCFSPLILSCIPLTCNSASSPYKTLSSTDQLGLSRGLTPGFVTRYSSSPSSRISSFPKEEQYVVRFSETTLPFSINDRKTQCCGPSAVVHRRGVVFPIAVSAWQEGSSLFPSYILSITPRHTHTMLSDP